jgi:hypothetical protein
MHAFWYQERELIAFFVSLSFYSGLCTYNVLGRQFGGRRGTWSYYDGTCRLHWKGSQHMKKDTMVRASERASRRVLADTIHV